MKRFSVAVLLLASVIYISESIKENKDEALRTRRMVGGFLTRSHVPWQALVYITEEMQDGGFGGGALIAPQWVLTSGRNLFARKTQKDTKDKEPLIPKVYLGITRRSDAGPSTEVAVEKVFLHPGFQNTSNFENDLALIQLKEPVTFSHTVFPIPLPENGEKQEETAGEMGIITGWGMGALLTPAEKLKYLSLPIDYCLESYNKFCTKRSEFKENVCYGDAGGALAFLDPKTNRVYAAGILSYDKTCSVEEHAVYMKISHYLPWIHSVMRGDSEQFSSLRASIMNRMYANQP
ncbi:haptoglobin [Trichomycterus rosablanca]|uniref:haptoglobin n=1 Tax=Trichomycterus rosablanca TaxID=2290929 RepID=UPI002F3596BB